MDYIFLISGFLLLTLSGDFLIKGSVSLAGHLKVSKLVVGIVVVSFGTSAPELVVSLDAALKGHPDIAIGNVIGSNIANVALVLGLTAMILPIKVKKNAIHFDWFVMMLSSILFYIFSLNNLIGFTEGLIFVLLLGLYIFRSLSASRKENKKSAEETVKPKHSIVISVVLVVFASVGLVYGADFLVKGASNIAAKLGINDRIISVSVIALGTSLPELAASISAAIRKELDIFIGNIIGSNIFNIMAILGFTSMIKPIHVNPMVLKFDVIWMLGIFSLLFIFILPLRKAVVSRWKGLIFVCIYLVYIYLIFTQH